MPDKPNNDESAMLLKALLVVAVDLRERLIVGDSSARKTELLLDSVGIAPSDIAKMLGKKPGTVRKALSRARQSGVQESED